LRESLGGAPIDLLVNNAGIMGGERQELDNMDYGAWMEAFEVNTIAPFRLVSAFRSNLRSGTRV
jgi:NAD(P)-dependent dehydrogenase (short-subunit alcohol dehydrogenase family)